jgi:hypothetical protein
MALNIEFRLDSLLSLLVLVLELGLELVIPIIACGFVVMQGLAICFAITCGGELRFD